MKNLQISWLLSTLFLCVSCGLSEREQKMQLSAAITHNFCQTVSTLMDSSVGWLDDPAGQLVLASISELIDVPLTNCCSCVEDAVKEKLVEKYSIEELMAIKDDGIKQLITLKNIIELHAVQDSIEQCVARNTVEAYDNFQEETQKKLREE